MTKTLIERLQVFAKPTGNSSFRGAEMLCAEAADEIERSNVLLDELRDAIGKAHGEIERLQHNDAASIKEIDWLRQQLILARKSPAEPNPNI